MMFDILVHDPKFWTALLFLVQTVLFYAVPDFPEQIWQAVSAILTIVFAALTANTTRVEQNRRAFARSMERK